MAEVQDTAPAPEPSMEEILASIRKIISDENTPGEGANDVVDLTQMVQDDGSIIDLSPVDIAVEEVEPPSPPPPPPPVAEGPVAAKPGPPLPVPPAPVMPPAPKDAGLVSEPAISASASALSSLASTLEIERLASAPAMSTYMGNGHRTLEDMVIELMRPMLKQWLDENLPATVDRLVQKEIERISRRTQE